MRSFNEVRRRLKQRRYRHQKKYLEAILGRVHTNCQHNAKVDAFGNGGYVCVHPELVQEQAFNVPVGALTAKQRRPTLPICDGSLLKDRAKTCEKFEARVSKKQAKEDFNRILMEVFQNKDHFAGIWPDMTQLIWVMDVDEASDILGLSPSESEEESSADPDFPNEELKDQTLALQQENKIAEVRHTQSWLVRLLKWLLKKVEAR